MSIYLIIGAAVIVPTLFLVALLWPSKCPKCGKRCTGDYYVPGKSQSFYWRCPTHDDINRLPKAK